MLTVALLSVVWLAAPAATDFGGRILAEDEAPVSGARVCELTQGAAERCVLSDEKGVFHLGRTAHPTVLVRAKGYLSVTVPVASLSAPVHLRRAAAILVTVVDAGTGKPVPDGRVTIETGSGARIGSFAPFNKAGVRISTLEPGLVFVRTEASGYDAGGPVPVELVRGSERAVTVPMTKAHGTPR